MNIPRAKVMSELVAPFSVRARLTGEDYTVRFSHLWSAVATRHSETLDCKFFVNGRSVTVALAHPGFVEFRARTGRSLTDEEAARVAAAYLRECLEGDRDTERSLLTVSREDVLRLTEKLGAPA